MTSDFKFEILDVKAIEKALKAKVASLVSNEDAEGVVAVLAQYETELEVLNSRAYDLLLGMAGPIQWKKALKKFEEYASTHMVDITAQEVEPILPDDMQWPERVFINFDPKMLKSFSITDCLEVKDHDENGTPGRLERTVVTESEISDIVFTAEGKAAIKAAVKAAGIRTKLQKEWASECVVRWITRHMAQFVQNTPVALDAVCIQGQVNVKKIYATDLPAHSEGSDGQAD